MDNTEEKIIEANGSGDTHGAEAPTPSASDVVGGNEPGATTEALAVADLPMRENGASHEAEAVATDNLSSPSTSEELVPLVPVVPDETPLPPLAVRPVRR